MAGIDSSADEQPGFAVAPPARRNLRARLSRSDRAFRLTARSGGLLVLALMVMVGTILIAVVAIMVAFPLALGTALYISEYAPYRLKRFFTLVIDLMAAVP